MGKDFRVLGGRKIMLLNNVAIPDTAVTTFDKCPNKCGGVLVEWTEAIALDDYMEVSYCANCEKRFYE